MGDPTPPPSVLNVAVWLLTRLKKLGNLPQLKTTDDGGVVSFIQVQSRTRSQPAPVAPWKNMT